MSAWLHEIAALTVVGLAAGWLVVRWLQIGKPRATQAGCSRCEHNPGRQGHLGEGSGIRSPRLRVLD